MAVLVLLTRAARTRIVPADLLVDMDRSIGLLFAIGGEIIAACLHLAHVGPAARSLGRTGLAVVTQRHERPEQERKHILVEILEHRGEEVITLELVHHEGIFLLISGILYAGTEIVHLAQMLFPMLINLVEDDGLA